MCGPGSQLNSVLIKPAGPDCNLACRYCFYLEKSRLFPSSAVHRMSDDVLAATVRQMMTAGSTNLSFGWQGGEPTLMGVDFFERAVELQKRHGRSGQTVGNGLQTNGLLIDADWCRFLRDARFLVGLSLDGPQHVHDHYRRTRGGQPTWDRVTAASKRMLDAGVEVNGLAVLNDYSARFPDEVYGFLKETGLRHVQFIPCLERDSGDPTHTAPFSVSAEQFGTFLCRVFDLWLDDFRDGQPTVFVRRFDSVFATYVGVRAPECTLLPECGEYLVIEHNGDVFSCDFYVEPDWKLGNVLDGELAQMLASPRQRRFGRRKAELPPECRTCRWLAHCRGGCPKERLGTPLPPREGPGEGLGNGPDGGLSYFCPAYKMFFSHADTRLRRLAERWLREQSQPAIGARPPRGVGRNDPCPCGSGRKYKRCCGR